MTPLVDQRDKVDSEKLLTGLRRVIGEATNAMPAHQAFYRQALQSSAGIDKRQSSVHPAEYVCKTLSWH